MLIVLNELWIKEFPFVPEQIKFSTFITMELAKENVDDLET